MEKNSPLIQKFFTIIIVTLFFAYGCAGVKPEQKPAPPVEDKVEQLKKEAAAPPPQPTPEPPVKPSPPPVPPPVSESPKATPSFQPLPSPSSPLRTTKIVWDSVNLREGPGLNSRVIGNVKKGISLSILEEKGTWLRVRLQNGSEAWVSKAATSEAPQSPPAATPKPKPM